MELPKIPLKPQKPQNTEEIILDIRQDGLSTNSAKKNGTSLLDLYNQLNQWVIAQSPIKLQEKLLFFEMLAATLNAGIPVAEALRMLETQSRNPRMGTIIRGMRQSIESGDSLAQAMENTDDVFDKATASIIAAGEKSGKLNEVMKELVMQYERMDMIGKKVKSVMTYPIVVIGFMILAAIVVMIFVVPKLTELFAGSENLPTPTRILVAMSDFFIHKWGLLLVGVTAVTVLFTMWKNSPQGKKDWTMFLLSLPILGEFTQKIVLSRVTRIFSFLITSGVPIIDSLRIASDVAGNVVYKRKFLLAADDLTRGIEISENFSDDPKLFPQMLVKMLAIGEKTASMGSILNKVADFYDEELDRKIKTISKLMEPFIMVVMAIGVGFLLMAIYLPILKMNDTMM
ncbi:type II secretion system F family protein [bacterium]|jgi:type IV pilus assembly protein PilC|nr:type II secretion system F family protein [bacterium]MBT6831782.1 type II secretion system F family protein [bacterium]MBT6995989.1 type II secretion system F family protein [bacterium]MBT7772640.1 type II secretion system F family protein [bacterium]